MADSVYQWGANYGTFNSKVPAQVVGERIESLRAELGEGITPFQFLDDARPSSSPTHDLFQWDDSEAAERYREHQARKVLQTIRIITVQPDETTPTALTVVNISAKNGGGERAYYPASVVVEDVDLLTSALQDIRQYLQGFKIRYQSLSGENATVDTIFNLLEELNIDGSN